MRGTDTKQGTMVTLLSPERAVPQTHSLRRVKELADAALRQLSPVICSTTSPNNARHVVLEMVHDYLPLDQRITLAGDKGYDTREFVEAAAS